MEDCLILICDFSISEEFPTYLLFRHLERFHGPIDARDVISAFIRDETRRRTRKGLDEGVPQSAESVKSIRASVIRCVSNYLALITRTSDFACDKVAREFTNEEISVVQVRTAMDFRSWLIKVLFVIDADLERDAYFTQMLNAVEKFILLEECFVPALIHINRREGIIDCTSVRRDYPFTIIPRSKD